MPRCPPCLPQQTIGIEPDKQATISSRALRKTGTKSWLYRADLAQLKMLSPEQSADLPGLNSRAETLRSAITSEASKVTSGNGSLSAHAPAFENGWPGMEFADSSSEPHWQG